MRKTLALFLFTVIVAACGSTGAASPSPAQTAAPSAAASQAPNPTAAPPATASPAPTQEPESGFYLRAYYTQALPPPSTFTLLPLLTIDSNQAIDGNVAIPAIFPGPQIIVPVSRSITDAGTALIVDEARRLGLLGDVTDYTGAGPMPGGRIANIQMIVDGVTYDLVGTDESACQGAQCQVDEGSPEAFAAFWQQLLYLDPWIGDELGVSQQYQPDRVAVLFTAPADGQGMEQQQVAWPLDENFDTVGVEFPGQENGRCRTYSGDDLADLLPTLLAANQLTIYHDSVDGLRSALAVVVVPGDESPCADEGQTT